MAMTLIGALPTVVVADPGDIGFAGPSGSGAGVEPSGSKPEAKVWFNDGIWWADMWDEASGDFYIWRLDRTTQTWNRTATRLDDRPSTRADVLWEGGKLYVASHEFSESNGSGTSRLYRYTYTPGTDTYALDAGFPAVINNVRSETLVLARDASGQLWATWEQSRKIWVNRTTGSDDAWGTPFQVPGSGTVGSDDVSSIIAFGGDKIGLFWSNQSAEKDFLAVHRDADADTTWQAPEVAYAGSDVADDHMNLKADSSGRLYAVVKTSLDGSSQPLVTLLARTTGGAWSAHTVSTGSTNHTRPILVIDETSALLRVYLTSKTSGGSINEKTSPLTSISFASGAGKAVMKDASHNDLNNATSTKQNVTSGTGLIVMAFNDTTERYWHADALDGGSTPTPTPTATPTGGPTTTFTAIEDAQVKSNSASTNYGSAATLQLRQDAGAGTTYHDYLKFTVTGLTGPVTSVRLRLFVTDKSADSGTVYSTTSGWAESTITWSNAPALDATALGSAGATTAGTWIEIALPTTSVTGNGTFSFGLTTGSSDSTIFGSSESANPPQLVIGI